MATAGQKDPGALLTIGELSEQLGVPQHILRYWETRFPQLKPMQRAGNRRYYRPADVELARRIHHLLGQEGYTVRGVQKLLRERNAAEVTPIIPADPPEPTTNNEQDFPERRHGGIDLFRLIALRDRLAGALED